MDVFTGAGEVVTTRPGDELFDAFPNSYGSLGYATRLRIRLEAVPAYVALRHVRFDDAALLAKTVAEVTASAASTTATASTGSTASPSSPTSCT